MHSLFSFLSSLFYYHLFSFISSFFSIFFLSFLLSSVSVFYSPSLRFPFSVPLSPFSFFPSPLFSPPLLSVVPPGQKPAARPRKGRAAVSLAGRGSPGVRESAPPAFFSPGIAVRMWSDFWSSGGQSGNNLAAAPSPSPFLRPRCSASLSPPFWTRFTLRLHFCCTCS